VISFAIILLFNIIQFKNDVLLQNMQCKIFSGLSLIILLQTLFVFWRGCHFYTQSGIADTINNPRIILKSDTCLLVQCSANLRF